MTQANPLEWTVVPGKRGDLFQWMPECARRDFSEMARLRTFRAGQLVFLHGDQGKEMYRIIQGTLRFSSMRSDGQEMVYALAGPGECVGSCGLIDGEAAPHTAEALEEAQLQVLSAASFRKLRETYREFDDALLRLMSSRMRLFSGYMANAALADMPNRVALRLLEVVRVGPGGELTIPITQSALAMLSGVSRQTINKILKQFESDHLVAVGYGSIELTNIDGLKRLVETS